MDLLAIRNAPDLIVSKTRSVRDAMLGRARCLKTPDFDRIGVDDLELLFGLYDSEFFGGWLGRAVVEATGEPLELRLSSTMTRAGGKTIVHRKRGRGGPVASRYEIAIASRMLFMNFSNTGRDVSVCGLACPDRLSALQRIMEHEMIHLGEMLKWDESSCSGVRFRTLAGRIFGHTDKHHALVTPREHAAQVHGIKVGSRVQFSFEGRSLSGRVNRIHHRATVLVEDVHGVRYTDGKHYHKFYVPLTALRLCETA